MNEIVMPKLSDTMTEGRVISWKKRVGDPVRRGEVLAEVETDKANMELESFTEGVLLEVRAQAGDLVQVGTVIAVIGSAEEKGAAQPAAATPAQTPLASVQAPPAPVQTPPGPEQAPPASVQTPPGPEQAPPAQASSAQVSATQSAPVGEPAPAPATSPAAAPAGEVGAQVHVTPPGEGQAPVEVQVATEPQAPTPESREAQAPKETPAPGDARPAAGGAPVEPQGAGGAVPGAGEAPAPPGSAGPHLERAAPVVRRRAREIGVDLSQIRGTGPEGRILLQDLDQQAGGIKAAPAVPPTPSSPGEAPAVAGETAQFSRLRQAVAKTVAESWRTIPHFSVTTDILMEDAEALRHQLKGSDIKVTLNDLVLKAVALALLRHPRLNASFTGDGMIVHPEVNLGVAVGVPDGVLVPVVRGCERLSLQQIAEATQGLVQRARSGGLGEGELSGGTFAVSNLGMYGISQFNAIIYPGQAGVLAVGAVTDAVVVRSCAPVCTRVMKVTISADHRLVDGAYAAEFLAELREILENPVRLLL